MQTGNVAPVSFSAGLLCRSAGALPLLALLASGALADEVLPHAAGHDFDTDAAVARAVMPLLVGERGLATLALSSGDVLEETSAVVPSAELAANLNVQLDRSRRKFRTRTIDWVKGRSVAVGQLADFLVGGADSGWHLRVDPRGDDEYMLQWQARFR